MNLLPTLERFFDLEAPLGPGDGLVVAYSGGPDSTALLAGLVRLAGRRRLRLVAAHLDHGLDPGSAARARVAADLATRLGVACLVERREVPRLRRRGEGVEEAARRVRYAFLDEVRRRLGALFVATAHHADDQAETVLLRLLAGSGVAGLGGIRPRLGPVVRPLLGLRRAALAASLAGTGVVPVHDPTNASPEAQRNRLRQRLIPALLGDDPQLVGRLAALSARARGAMGRIEATLEAALQPIALDGGVAVPRRAFVELPPALRPLALALLHRRAGAAYPPSSAAARELGRQLAAGRRVGCSAGGGLRWESRRHLLFLAGGGSPSRGFSYTLKVPGEVAIPEARERLRIRRGPVSDWMFRPWPTRAGLALPVGEGEIVEVRSRRPGDRLQPLGHSAPRRLKELLIDAGVPRLRRDRLPLLCVGGAIAWVPGVAVAESCRLPAAGRAWIAELVAEEEEAPPAGVVECRGPVGGFVNWPVRPARGSEESPF